MKNDKYYTLLNGAEELLLKKNFTDALKNYKTILEIDAENETIKEKIRKLERYFFLQKKISEKKSEYDYNKAMQLALKLVLNGTYGAFANKYFVLSNEKIANAITAMGRNVIQYMLENIENYFYNEWHLDKKTHDLIGKELLALNKLDNCYYFLNKNYEPIDRPYKEFNTGDINNDILKSRNINLSKLTKIENYEKNNWSILYEYNLFKLDKINPLDETPEWEKINENKPSTSPDEIYTSYKSNNPLIIYGDTDSISSDTEINTNKGKYTIEEFYNHNIKNGSGGITLNGHESVKCFDKVLNWNNNLYYAPVKRIIRHKVTKPKWKLKTKSGKEILVTNDHSMIVFRYGKQLEVKPSDILKTDKILIVNEKI